MTIDAVLSATLDLAFLALVLLAVRDLRRGRTRTGWATLGVFVSVFAVFGLGTVGDLVPALAPVTGALGFVALLAMAACTIELVHGFHPLPRWLRGGVWLGLAAFSVIAVLITADIDMGLGVTGTLAVVVIAMAAFAGLELFSAAVFWAEARRRAGTARLRLRIAGLATALMALAAITFVIGGLSALEHPEQAALVTVAVGLLALLSAIGYLVAFSPLAWVRRVTQQATAFDYVRTLDALPAGTPIASFWEGLATAARELTGATGVAVLPHGSSLEPLASRGHWPRGGRASGDGVMVVSTGLDSRLDIDLGLRLAGSPLFVEDDLEVLRLLARRTVVAAEREHVLAERGQLITELQAASAAKSDFLAAMSHELRTPLNAIIGFSELLTRPPTPAGHDAATVSEFAGHIHGSGLHLLELINEVLDLAKVEAGKLELRPVMLDLTALVRATIETTAPLSERKAITVAMHAPPRLDLEADPGRIRQVVLNLLSNAIKFTPEGGRVAVTLGAHGSEVRLSVSDTGTGIAAEDQAAVFEAFKQVGQTAGAAGGTGLGLALVRQLVEAHGGTVGVVSELGQGSTFTVTLPGTSLAAPPAPAPVAVDDRPVILAIEDDPAAAELLRVYLEGAGFQVVVAPDGRSGAAWARQVQPVAIVLDILLPDTDGWDVLQQLKGQPTTRDIPVIVVSVLDDAPLGFALGAVDYFVKPVERQALLGAIGRLTFTTKVRTRTVTVLVIDGDDRAAERYGDLLEPDGFRVLVAPNAEAGIARARLEKPDLILVDLVLPDLDGPELVARLRADPATADIPVWVSAPDALTGDTRSRLRDKLVGAVSRGDGTMDALRGWLDQVGARPSTRP